MSGQQPGPVPENTAIGHDAGQPVPVAAPGPAAPGPAQGWGAPPALSGAPLGWGAPAAARPVGAAAKPWTLKRGLAVGGAALVLAAGAGVGVYALTSSSAFADGSTRAAAGGLTGPDGQGAQGGQGGFAGGAPGGQGGPGNFTGGGAAGGLPAALHGEYVVLQGTSYVNKAEQLGTVTEVSADSVTVKSADGFTRSYKLGGDVVVGSQQQRRQQAGGTTGSQLTVADILAGGTVRIVAAKNGSDYAAETVTVLAAGTSGPTS